MAHLVIDNTKVLNLFNDSSCFFLDLGDNFMLSASLFLIPSCSARSHRIISFFIIISYHWILVNTMSVVRPYRNCCFKTSSVIIFRKLIFWINLVWDILIFSCVVHDQCLNCNWNSGEPAELNGEKSAKFTVYRKRNYIDPVSTELYQRTHAWLIKNLSHVCKWSDRREFKTELSVELNKLIGWSEQGEETNNHVLQQVRWWGSKLNRWIFSIF